MHTSTNWIKEERSDFQLLVNCVKTHVVIAHVKEFVKLDSAV